jgi:hypothetical protein
LAEKTIKNEKEDHPLWRSEKEINWKKRLRQLTSEPHSAVHQVLPEPASQVLVV